MAIKQFISSKSLCKAVALAILLTYILRHTKCVQHLRGMQCCFGSTQLRSMTISKTNNMQLEAFIRQQPWMKSCKQTFLQLHLVGFLQPR